MTENFDKDRLKQWRQNVLPVESAEQLKSLANSTGSLQIQLTDGIQMGVSRFRKLSNAAKPCKCLGYGYCSAEGGKTPCEVGFIAKESSEGIYIQENASD